MSKRLLDVHICELPKISDSNLPKLPPNARFYARWKRNFQKIFLVSVNHPLTQNFLRSLAAIAFEKRRHGRSSTWWVIHPCSNLRYYWDFLMTFTYLYMFIAIPYILAFQRVAKSSGPESWNPVHPAYIICIFDIVLNFITGFKSRDGHEIFLDPFLIIRHYMKTYFLIDFISSVPYVWFYKDRILPPGPNSNSILLIFELLPVLKIFRIYTLRFYIQQIIANFTISHSEEKAIWLIVLVLLIFHWYSCVTHIFPFIVAHITGVTKENSDMYLITTGLYKKSDSDIYLVYCHIGINVSFVFKSVQSAAEPELKYQRIMHQVKEYIHEKKLPENLKKKLIAYYEYRFQGSYFKERAISRTLSSHLNQEIMIHSSRGLIDTATILHSLPRNVIGYLMGILRPVIYLQEDIIYKSRTEGDCMFFIISGTVALITFNGKEICHEKDGGYFGEAALIFPDQRRLESVIALERLENVAKQRYKQINELNFSSKDVNLETSTLIEKENIAENAHQVGDTKVSVNNQDYIERGTLNVNKEN
ncbi:Potassium/sodium hyperpolarization-activated cyclic nucleotide-gated channel 2 [Melipona quadrifasciata]|uniref:Potassium/sodium hyperpolarization-activated cyclic nucleotide-gated channel 2 n=1 Tax=Melipona quadrifasciata TaxID=166423 RepID=A0A0M9A8Q4_9HYME|nr:Potassium/sodium hyperpolarization-activated cyclic nucleotide-gated channel 2 [Melipona quadrifasciata]